MGHWSDTGEHEKLWRRALPGLFADINDVDVNTARRRFEEHTLAAGEVVCREGEEANELVCVRFGRLSISAGDQHLSDAGPDDLLGEMALFEEGVRTATVTAATDTTILTLNRKGYEALRDTAHPVVRNIETIALQHQVARLRDTGARVAKHARGTPIEPAALGERFRAAVRSLFGPGGPFSMTAPAEPRDALARSTLFAEVPAVFLDVIAEPFVARAYQPGELLCVQGERGSGMYVLGEGQVDVVVRDPDGQPRQVATLSTGAAFGMVAMVVPGPRMASVIAKTPVVVHYLDNTGWDNLASHPWGPGSAFRRAVIRAFSAQLATTNAQLVAYEGDHQVDALERAAAAFT